MPRKRKHSGEEKSKKKIQALLDEKTEKPRGRQAEVGLFFLSREKTLLEYTPLKRKAIISPNSPDLVQIQILRALRNHQGCLADSVGRAYDLILGL